VQLYLVKITTGDHAGRFIGPNFGGGLVTNPDVQKNPPLRIENTKYSSHGWQRGATHYFEHAAQPVQAELKAAGYGTELVPVQ
jgi:hypothetical protein